MEKLLQISFDILGVAVGLTLILRPDQKPRAFLTTGIIAFLVAIYYDLVPPSPLPNLGTIVMTGVAEPFIITACLLLIQNEFPKKPKNSTTIRYMIWLAVCLSLAFASIALYQSVNHTLITRLVIIILIIFGALYMFRWLLAIRLRTTHTENKRPTP